MERLDAPPGRIPIIPVTLDDAQWKKLEDYISQEIDQALTDRKPLEKSWEIWAQQYNSRLLRKDQGDAQLDSTMTFKMLRQESAKVLAQLFKEPEFWLVKPKTPIANLFYRDWERAIRHVWDKFENLEFCTVAFRQARVFSYVVEKNGWTVERETALGMVNVSDPQVQRMMEDDPDSPVAVILDQALVEKTYDLRVGCFPEVVPIEDFIYPWYSTDIRTAPWLTHRSWPTKFEMEDLIDEGMLPETLRDGKKTLEVLGGPGTTRPKTFALEQMDGVAKNPTTGDSRHYELCEVYLDWRVDGSRKRKSLIAYYERSNKRLLHVVYNWLTEYRRPFELWTGEERDDGIPGVSMAYRLEPLHRAKSSSVRQRLDAATLANKILIYVSNKDLYDQHPGGVITPGIHFTNADVEKEMKQFKLSEPGFHQLENLEQGFDNEAMVISGLADPDFGDMPGDRVTATGLMKTTEMGGLPADLMRESFRRFLSRVAKQMLARYRQFFPDGLPLYLQKEGPQGLQAFVEILTWPIGTIEENIQIETVVSSATLNKNLRKQEKIAVADKLPQLYQFMLTLAEAAAQTTPIAFVAKLMLRGYVKVVDDMLNELDVEDREDILGGLEEALNVGQLFSEALAMAQQQAAKLQSDNEALALENAQLQGGGGLGPGEVAAPGLIPGMEGTSPMGIMPAGPAGQGVVGP